MLLKDAKFCNPQIHRRTTFHYGEVKPSPSTIILLDSYLIVCNYISSTYRGTAATGMSSSGNSLNLSSTLTTAVNLGRSARSVCQQSSISS